MIQKKKATVKELQSLCGYLNFLCKAIYPGRTFAQRMYAQYSDVVNFAGSENDHKICNFKKKQYHHIKLSSEFKIDCRIWLEFLTGEISTVVCRPMTDLVDINKIQLKDIGLYSDASVSKRLGFGSILKTHWIQEFWPEGFVENNKPSIEFLELYALIAGVLTWELELSNIRAILHCDNMAVVHMINNMVSKCANCMRLLRLLILSGLKFNRRLTAVYINTKDNGLSDALSRGQWERFRRLGPNMEIVGDKITDQIWPISKIWISDQN